MEGFEMSIPSCIHQRLFGFNGVENLQPECLRGTDGKEKVILSGTVPLWQAFASRAEKIPLPAVSWMNERDSFQE